MKKRAEEPGPEISGWAIPYGDFLTLMLAVFIAMYAVSQVNTAKYHALAESLSRAFHGSTAVVQPVPPAQQQRAMPAPHPVPITVQPISLIPVPIPPRNLPIPGNEGAAAIRSPGQSLSAATVTLREMSTKIAEALSPWIKVGAVQIQQGRWWLAITIRTDVLFPEGEANLPAPSQSLLAKIAKVLAKFPNPVRVEGYTDDLPIHTVQFPSNWELSASRAASVARLFGAAGVNPHRMGIVGWGPYRPVASNGTAAGRARNRRIVVLALANEKAPAGKATGNADVDASFWEPLPPDTVTIRKPAAAIHTIAANAPTTPVAGAHAVER